MSLVENEKGYKKIISLNSSFLLFYMIILKTDTVIDE